MGRYSVTVAPQAVILTGEIPLGVRISSYPPIDILPFGVTGNTSGSGPEVLSSKLGGATKN